MSNLSVKFDKKSRNQLIFLENIGRMVGVAGFEPTTPCPPDK